jgi:murein endopeptidase
MRLRRPTSVWDVRVPIAAALVAIAAALAVAAGLASRGSDDAPRSARPPSVPGSAAPRAERPAAPAPRRPREAIRWRRSTAVGSPAAGRLIRGVRLPAERPTFFTWDPVLKRSPNRPWRRWGTDRLVRILLDVAREFRAAHPRAPRLAIGDLSRPRGGDFGRRFGPIGHASHQNGLDADIYYPRADRRERAPRRASQIDRRLSQELVDRFLAKGADVIFVGPRTGLTGPAGRVQELVNHDNHLHVRIRAAPRR